MPDAGGADARIIEQLKKVFRKNPSAVIGQLWAFWEVGRSGAYNGAGITLGRSRGATLKQVRELQRRLGERLVDPVPARGVLLTEQGERVWWFLQRLLAPVDQGMEQRRSKQVDGGSRN